MATITLIDPLTGEITDAGQQQTNNQALRTVLNGGIDQANISPSATPTVSRLTASLNSKTALQLPGATAGLTIDGDTNLYRGGPDLLQTDDNFKVLGNATINGSLTVTGSVVGVNVEEWLGGGGAPAGATGDVGDWYLDYATGNVYEKTGGSA